MVSLTVQPVISKSLAPLADVIILAVPIKQTVAYLQELADLDLKDNVIITDAGSTKLDIVEAAERYLTGKMFSFRFSPYGWFP